MLFDTGRWKKEEKSSLVLRIRIRCLFDLWIRDRFFPDPEPIFFHFCDICGYKKRQNNKIPPTPLLLLLLDPRSGIRDE